jgi:peroxiredoxin
MVESKGVVKFHGNDVPIVGEDIQLGQQAPEFTAQTADWKEMKSLADRDGKVVYAAYMPELGDEPDYTQILEAVEKAL